MIEVYISVILFYFVDFVFIFSYFLSFILIFLINQRLTLITIHHESYVLFFHYSMSQILRQNCLIKFITVGICSQRSNFVQFVRWRRRRIIVFSIYVERWKVIGDLFRAENFYILERIWLKESNIILFNECDQIRTNRYLTTFECCCHINVVVFFDDYQLLSRNIHLCYQSRWSWPSCSLPVY